MRKKAGSSKSARPSNRTRQIRTPIANSVTTPVRKPSRPPLTEPFHVAVDRQVKSGYETYEAAEKVAQGIKKRYPKLHVTVFDAKEQRHTLIKRPTTADASNKNRLAEPAARNTGGRHKAAVAGGRH
jgi:hypothetical protein